MCNFIICEVQIILQQYLNRFLLSYLYVGKMSQVLRLNKLMTKCANEILNRKFLNYNIGPRLLGSFKVYVPLA